MKDVVKKYMVLTDQGRSIHYISYLQSMQCLYYKKHFLLFITLTPLYNTKSNDNRDMVFVRPNMQDVSVVFSGEILRPMISRCSLVWLVLSFVRISCGTPKDEKEQFTLQTSTEARLVVTSATGVHCRVHQ